MINKDLYLEKLKKFYDEGLINDIYSNEEILIMNITNSAYYMTNYQFDKNGFPIAVVIDVKTAKKVIEDNMFFYKYISEISDSLLKKSTISFNLKVFQLMKNVKQRNDIIGPSEFIDLEFEESIKNKTK